MDLCLFGQNHGIDAVEVAKAAGITPEQVERVYASIEGKRRATAYLHLGPQLAEEIPQAGH
jgi:NAD+ synthase